MWPRTLFAVVVHSPIIQTMNAAAQRPSVPPVGTTLFERFRVTGRDRADGCSERYFVRPVSGGAVASARVFTHPVFTRAAQSVWEAAEAKLQRLTTAEHPNIERVLGAGVVSLGEFERLCVITELTEGEALDARIHAHKRLPFHDATDIANRVLHGLAAIHQLGLVHGDLRASNVRFAKALNTGDVTSWPVLCDVGVNAVLLDAVGRVGALRDQMLAPEFMAPEQIEGEAATVATDIYAFGLLLYTMLSGTGPFAADDDSELVVAKLTREPRTLLEAGATGVPDAMEALVQRCLARNPAERYESTVSLLRALRECDATLGATPLHGVPALRGLSRPPIAREGDTPGSTSRVVARSEGKSLRASTPLASPDQTGRRARESEPLARVSAPPEPAKEAAPSVPVAQPARASLVAEVLPVAAHPVVDDMARARAAEIARLKRWVLIVGLLTVACGVLVAAVVVEKKRFPIAPVPLSVRARPLLPASVRLTLRSNAAGAVAELRGVSYTLPMAESVASGTEPELVEVSAPGWTSRRMWLVLEANTEMQIDLSRQEAPPEAPVRAIDLDDHATSRRARHHHHSSRHHHHDEAPEAPTQPSPDAGANVPGIPLITGAVIQRVVRSHRGDVDDCVRRARTIAPIGRARLAMALRIDHSGGVRSAEWDGAASEAAMRNVALCVAERARTWVFPPTGSVEDIQVVYPFHIR